MAARATAASPAKKPAAPKRASNLIFELKPDKEVKEETITVKFEGEFTVRSTPGSKDGWGNTARTALQNAKDFAEAFADTGDYDYDYNAKLTSFKATKV